MDIVGADLGGTNFRAGLVRDGSIQKAETAAIDGGAAQDALLDELYRLIDAVISPEAKGIGIGVPSVVNLKRGIVYETTNLRSWKEVPLKDLLETRYKLPVYVNNDANCFAAGEKQFGKAKGFDSAVCLIMGTGFGAGIIANGRLYSGPNCGAGEFGMIPYLKHNYEYYCCGQFFRDEHKTTGKELFTRAEQGEQAAMDIFREFGRHVGEALKTILYAVDPEIIVLGGSVSGAYEYFSPSMREAMQSFGYSRSVKNLKIAVSDTHNSAILGAAALYYDAHAKHGDGIL